MINENANEEGLILITQSLPRARAKKREALIMEISNKFIQLCKSRELITFPREHLNFLMEELNTSKRCKEMIVTQILKFMTSKEMIREDTIVKKVYTFRNKPLSCADYGSYNLLMQKNGYKRVFFKYIKRENSFPLRKKVLTLPLHKAIPDLLDYDETELRSSKGRTQQGVTTNSHKSVMKDFCYYQEKKVYSII